MTAATWILSFRTFRPRSVTTVSTKPLKHSNVPASLTFGFAMVDEVSIRNTMFTNGLQSKVVTVELIVEVNVDDIELVIDDVKVEVIVVVTLDVFVAVTVVVAVVVIVVV